jgi:hypothetical protein
MTTLTPNQVVATHLANERRRRRLTQEQFCETFEPYLGVRWSAAVLSAVERSVDGRRIREFTADEIVAVARLAGESVAFVLSPPKDVQMVTPDYPEGLPLEEVSVIVDPDPHLRERFFDALLAQFPDVTLAQAVAMFEEVFPVGNYERLVLGLAPFAPFLSTGRTAHAIADQLARSNDAIPESPEVAAKRWIQEHPSVKERTRRAGKQGVIKQDASPIKREDR